MNTKSQLARAEARRLITDDWQTTQKLCAGAKPKGVTYGAMLKALKDLTHEGEFESRHTGQRSAPLQFRRNALPPLLTEEEKRRIEQAAATLNAVLERVKARRPDRQVCYFLDGTCGLHLMNESHDDWTPKHANIFFSVRLNAGGGDW